MKAKSHNDLAAHTTRRARRPRATPARVTFRAAPRLMTAALLLLLPFAAAAQQGRPAIADEIRGDRPRPKPDAKNSGRTEADSPLPRAPRPPARRASRPAPPPRPAAAPTLPVIIVTDPPGADVFLNLRAGGMQKLGRTGADGKLSVRLPRGVHSVTASRPGSRILRQQLDVRPGQTTFGFDLAGRGAVAAGVPVAAPAVSAEEVIARFTDPKRTDSVTLADWQAAQAQTAAAYSQNAHDPLVAAQAHFAHGQVAYLKGDYGTALVSFNNAALVLPNSALAFYGLGNAYLATNQLGEAARAYAHAVKLNTSLAVGYKGMGDVLLRQGKDKPALDYYARARGLGYAPHVMEMSTARALLRLRRWPQAQKLLTELARARPSAEAYVGLGDAYVGLKQPLSAVAAYRQAAQADPKSALAHYKLGELSFQQREYATAYEALERALVLDPAGQWLNRGKARELADKAAERLGRKD